MKPLVSVTLPIARSADPDLLRTCLLSIRAQSYPNIETLVLVSSSPPSRHIEVLGSFPSILIHRAEKTKSAARNSLARNAQGDFLVFLDIDMQLPATWIADCLSLAVAEGRDAVITPVVRESGGSFWDRCRALEKELLIGDPGAEAPLFVRTTTFFKSGGFDESLDPLDDWALTLALERSGSAFGRVDVKVIVRESTSPSETFSRKYMRGRLLSSLKAKYPEARQVDFTRRFKAAYLQNWRLLLRSPLASIGLAVLKIVDIIGLWLGNKNPPDPALQDGTRVYFDPLTAQDYERIRFGNGYNRYKHYAEVRNLGAALPTGPARVVEVGSGTGRITRVLSGRGLSVIPVEPSSAMVRHYWASSRPRSPVVADGRALPFPQDSFDGSVSLRVLWHLPRTQDIETMLAEMSRVSTSFLIFDIANSARWHNPVMKMVAGLYFGRREADSKAHSSTCLLTLGEVEAMAVKIGLRCERVFPMDILAPLWLNLLPIRLGTTLFPAIYALERALRGIVPPGRYLVTLGKQNSHMSRRRTR